MSPSFARLFAPGEVIVVIGADALCAVELGGWRRQRLAELRLPLQLEEGVPQWEALEAWLAERSAKRLVVRLSSAWVRFAVMPWQDELASPKLAEALAEALFAEQYGEASAGWQRVLSPARPGDSRIAAAIDQRWSADLQALAQRCRMRLAAVEPLLVSVYNRLADRLPDDALLAVVEPRRLSLVQIADGRWHSLYNRVLPEPWQRRLPGLIAQTNASLDALGTPIFIAAPMFEREELGRLSATWLRLPPRPGFDPRADRLWAFCQGC